MTERKAEWAKAGLEVGGIRTSSKAARATRRRKDHAQTDERTVYGRWEAELAGHGIDAQAIARVHGLDRLGRPASDGDRDRPYQPLTEPQATRLLAGSPRPSPARRARSAAGSSWTSWPSNCPRAQVLPPTSLPS